MNVEERMDADELRRELRRAWDTHHALMQALSELPVVPPVAVLGALADAKSTADDWERGKRLQRKHGLKAIPPVSEYERGAGLWDSLRRALRIARHERTGTTVIGEQTFDLSPWSGDIFEWGDQADLHKSIRRAVQGPIEAALKEWRSRGFQPGQGREAAEEAAEAVVEYLLSGECVPAQEGEAGTATTGTGVVHEHPVGVADAPDADLLAAYHACDAEPGDAWLDALTAEIERRGIDI